MRARTPIPGRRRRWLRALGAAGAAAGFAGCWRHLLFTGTLPALHRTCHRDFSISVAVVATDESLKEESAATEAPGEDVTEAWKAALEAERARSDLLLAQVDKIAALAGGQTAEEKASAMQALYEDLAKVDSTLEACAITWGADEFEQLKECNDRLQQALAAMQEPGAGAPGASGRLDGIGAAVEVLPPAARSNEIALVANAPHVRVSLPLGLQGLMWGSDLTPFFDEAGDRLMVFVASLPLGMRIVSAERPEQAPEASGSVLRVDSVSPSSEAEANGIRVGDYLRAVSYMAPGEEPGFLDKMLGATAIPLPKVLKCDGLTVEEVSEAIQSNADTPDGTATLLLERPP